MLEPDSFDKEGFLKERSLWTPDVAKHIATLESIELEEPHWEVIHLLQQYYDEFDSSPAMRALVKCCKINLGDEKGKSIYLMKLFPGSPAKIGSKIAGLPKPDNCL
jgi:tRNA 2-thiouridine synthesizing protein E